MLVRSAIVMLLLAAAGVGCNSPVGPGDPDVVRMTGTIRFESIEGGFWTVRGDDNVTYDPVDGLPAAFQVEGLRVRLVARRLRDTATIHMAGPIVEILTITRLN